MGGAPRIKPDAARTLLPTLVARRPIGASFLRLTLAGPDLADFVPLGFDQWFRLFLPAGEDGPNFNLGLCEAIALVGNATGQRPTIRNYTVADYRPAGPGRDAELDFDVYAGSHPGPGIHWASEAPLGSVVGVLDEGLLHAPPKDATHQLLVGDESALVAIAGILRDSDAHVTGLAVLEIAHDADCRELPSPAGLQVVWVTRSPGQPPGEAAEAAVLAAELPTDQPWDFAYLAGPSAMVTSLRRHLVTDLGVDRTRVAFTGYWR